MRSRSQAQRSLTNQRIICRQSSLFHQRWYARAAVLSDAALRFLLEGLIGLSGGLGWPAAISAGGLLSLQTLLALGATAVFF
jgi:hypothetical protein